MVLRFCSGSDTPFRAFKNRSDASTPFTFSPIPLYCSNTLLNSFLRNRPLLRRCNKDYLQWLCATTWPLLLNQRRHSNLKPPCRRQVVLLIPLPSFLQKLLASTWVLHQRFL